MEGNLATAGFFLSPGPVMNEFQLSEQDKGLYYWVMNIDSEGRIGVFDPPLGPYNGVMHVGDSIESDFYLSDHAQWTGPYPARITFVAAGFPFQSFPDCILMSMDIYQTPNDPESHMMHADVIYARDVGKVYWQLYEIRDEIPYLKETAIYLKTITEEPSL